MYIPKKLINALSTLEWSKLSHEDKYDTLGLQSMVWGRTQQMRNESDLTNDKCCILYMLCIFLTSEMGFDVIYNDINDTRYDML